MENILRPLPSFDSRRAVVSYSRKYYLVQVNCLTARTFRKLLSVYIFSYFPFGFEGRIWDLIVSVPDHCLSFYFAQEQCG